TGSPSSSAWSSSIVGSPSTSKVISPSSVTATARQLMSHRYIVPVAFSLRSSRKSSSVLAISSSGAIVTRAGRVIWRGSVSGIGPPPCLFTGSGRSGERRRAGSGLRGGRGQGELDALDLDAVDVAQD